MAKIIFIIQLLSVVVLGATTTSLTLPASHYLISAPSADVTVPLGTALVNRHREVCVKKVDSTPYDVVVDPSGAETIDGFTQVYLQNQYETMCAVSDGTTWNRF